MCKWHVCEVCTCRAILWISYVLKQVIVSYKQCLCIDIKLPLKRVKVLLLCQTVHMFYFLLHIFAFLVIILSVCWVCSVKLQQLHEEWSRSHVTLPLTCVGLGFHVFVFHVSCAGFTAR